ncbi:glutathione ABC transporter substrate-binding protein [Tumebacillus permanentifrigoris]|uniref:Glutathione-binding protein GsiB n=1 Tax=Tumebacillus permanentifrigoris TaxID=378543 RepID=A0A316DGQ2_9BACL|nr:glutathione ABC transporter substrate-binding protein [Tumebacillus permanentifrigoris]PWK16419.1 glutathione transport system substrate-binding protein [Tumebacillus permanentifrigoris]
MTSKQTVKLALTSLLAASVVLAGCSTKTTESSTSSTTSTTTEKKSMDLTVAQAANPTTMDPQDAQDTLSFSIMKTMYEGLLGFDKDMKVIPVLAESLPTLSSDAKEVTFKLKQGIKFQDGTDFNAEAVKANLDRVTDPNNKLKRASLFAVVDHTVVVDPNTVKIVLNKPFAAIVETFAHPAAMMISPKAIKDFGKDVQRNPVGTGPFQFVEWKDADHLIVKKFADYHDKNNVAKLETINFKPVTEASSRVSMLKAGDAQYVYPYPSDQADAVKDDKNIVLDKSSSIVERYIAFNTTKKPFDDKRVRQALNYAVNKEALIKVVAKGYAQEAKSAIAPNVWGYQEQATYKYDPEKAKKLLADAGLTNGFETTIWTANQSESVKVAEFIQQQWKLIGVTANVQQMESGTLTNQMYVKPEESKMMAYSGGWSPSTGEADWGLRPLLTKDLFPPAGFNVGYYVNDTVEQAIAKGLSASDKNVRLQAYADAQKQIMEDAPWLFLYVSDNLAGKRKNVEGAFVLPDGALDLTHAEIK